VGITTQDLGAELPATGANGDLGAEAPTLREIFLLFPKNKAFLAYFGLNFCLKLCF